jgi:hypothetical protein
MNFRVLRKPMMTALISWTNVEVTLRQAVSRPVRLGVRHPSGTRDQFSFLLEIFFRQLPVCYFVAPSLTRGRVCNLLLLLVLASAVALGLLSLARGLVFFQPFVIISPSVSMYTRYLHYLCLTQFRDVYTRPFSIYLQKYLWPNMILTCRKIMRFLDLPEWSERGRSKRTQSYDTTPCELSLEMHSALHKTDKITLARAM